MPAHLINTSNRINANVAGQTRSAADAAAGSAPVATTLSETAANLNPANALDSLFAGGVHPETVPGATPTPLEKPTNSVKGLLGGLKPATGSTVAPGPAGSTAAAKTVQAGTQKITDATTAGAKAARTLFNRIGPTPKGS
jgi:hypothetical protein